MGILESGNKGEIGSCIQTRSTQEELGYSRRLAAASPPITVGVQHPLGSRPFLSYLFSLEVIPNSEQKHNIVLLSSSCHGNESWKWAQPSA